jgi:hypothetical protein
MRRDLLQQSPVASIAQDTGTTSADHSGAPRNGRIHVPRPAVEPLAANLRVFFFSKTKDARALQTWYKRRLAGR